VGDRTDPIRSNQTEPSRAEPEAKCRTEAFIAHHGLVVADCNRWRDCGDCGEAVAYVG
jgi:hypothetical protein